MIRVPFSWKAIPLLAAIVPAALPAALPQPAAADTLPPARPVVKTAEPSPLVGDIAGGSTAPVLEVHKRAATRTARRHRHVARVRHLPADPDRPPLAGVFLVTPVPAPMPEPQIVVPAPAYLVDSIPAAFTTPAPPLVCERVPRDPSLPDPRLRREVPLACRYDTN